MELDDERILYYRILTPANETINKKYPELVSVFHESQGYYIYYLNNEELIPITFYRQKHRNEVIELCVAMGVDEIRERAKNAEKYLLLYR